MNSTYEPQSEVFDAGSAYGIVTAYGRSTTTLGPGRGPENWGADAAPRGCALWGRRGPHLKIIHSGN
jgi:hypothetical protein